MGSQMNENIALDADFWRAFSRAMGRAVEPGHYQVAQIAEWDSLRHVELIFELEESLRVDIPPDAIAGLYSDTDTLLSFLRSRGAASR